MRARLPDEAGYVVNDGVRIYYEVQGIGILLGRGPHNDSSLQ